MKPTELRIGNYIYSNNFNSICKIEMFLGLADVTLINLYGYDEHYKSIDELKPIPLTEEWLLRFENVSINIYGEVIVENKNSNGFEIIIFEFKYGNLYYTAGEGAKLSPPIEFLHQFQNYVYLLSGGYELKLKK